MRFLELRAGMKDTGIIRKIGSKTSGKINCGDVAVS
jgi:hypothetical protein